MTFLQSFRDKSFKKIEIYCESQLLDIEDIKFVGCTCVHVKPRSCVNFLYIVYKNLTKRSLRCIIFVI